MSVNRRGSDRRRRQKEMPGGRRARQRR